MVVPMLRPDVFGALASHAGDALFECCYLPEFPSVARDPARRLRRLLRGVSRAPGRESAIRLRDVRQAARDVRLCLRLLAGSRPPRRGAAAVRHRDRPPDRTMSGSGGWRSTRCGWRSPHADALRSMRRIYLDAGRRDEWFLDLGAQAFAEELTQLESTTRSSCSTAATAVSRTAIRARSASWWWRSHDRDLREPCT